MAVQQNNNLGLEDSEKFILKMQTPKFLGLLEGLDNAEARQSDPTRKAEIHSLRTALYGMNSEMRSAHKLEKAKQFEAALSANPGMEKKLLDLATSNPQAVEKILPELNRNPSSLPALVNRISAAPAVDAPQPSAGADLLPPVVTFPIDDPAPVQVKPQSPPQAFAPTAGLSGDMQDKVNFLLDNGGVELMQQIEASSPESATKLQQMLTGEDPDGAPVDMAKRDELIDGLYDRTKANPNYLRQLGGAMKSFPGVTGSSLNLLASNPEQGLKMADAGLQMSSFLTGILEFLKNPSMEGFMTAMQGMMGGAKTQLAQTREMVASGDTALAREAANTVREPGRPALPILNLDTGLPLGDSPLQPKTPQQIQPTQVSSLGSGGSFMDKTINPNPEPSFSG